MISLSAASRLAVSIFFALLLVACDSSRTAVDEQKDPHYLNGRARVTSLDYKGAIEEFEKALEGNPHSASAHLELGLLYEEHMQDFAAAIYHYERHLKLRPTSEYAERAKDRVRACKAELVKTEYVAPVTQGMQRELERLMTENMLLKQRIETLESQLNTRPMQVVNNTPRQQTQIAVPAPITNSPQTRVEQTPRGTTSRAETSQQRTEPTPTRTRTHTVKSGETLTNIARKYGVDLTKLIRANPRVDPTRLRVGQTLNIP